jgi:hypothetical protein
MSMTVAELIRRLQSLDVSPDTPINFLVNDFNKAEVETIEVQAYTRANPGGSWKVRKEVDFNLYSDDVG